MPRFLKISKIHKEKNLNNPIQVRLWYCRTPDIAPVNNAVPQIRLINQAVQMSFIVDTSQIPYMEWNWDGLGRSLLIIFIICGSF